MATVTWTKFIHTWPLSHHLTHGLTGGMGGLILSIITWHNDNHVNSINDSSIQFMAYFIHWLDCTCPLQWFATDPRWPRFQYQLPPVRLWVFDTGVECWPSSGTRKECGPRFRLLGKSLQWTRFCVRWFAHTFLGFHPSHPLDLED